jgi:hypothetical protein
MAQYEWGKCHYVPEQGLVVDTYTLLTAICCFWDGSEAFCIYNEVMCTSTLHLAALRVLVMMNNEGIQLHRIESIVPCVAIPPHHATMHKHHAFVTAAPRTVSHPTPLPVPDPSAVSQRRAPGSPHRFLGASQSLPQTSTRPQSRSQSRFHGHPTDFVQTPALAESIFDRAKHRRPLPPCVSYRGTPWPRCDDRPDRMTCTLPLPRATDLAQRGSTVSATHRKGNREGRPSAKQGDDSVQQQRAILAGHARVLQGVRGLCCFGG